MPDQPLTFKVKRHLVDPTVPPKPAHKFMYTRVGTDIVLDVGYYDLPELRQAVETTKARVPQGPQTDLLEVTLYVTDRFTLTPQGVADLAQVVQELQADVRTNVVAAEPPPVPGKKPEPEPENK